jgi:hypothetical protein
MILILGLNPSLSMMILLTLNFVAGVPTTIDYHKLILDIEVGVSFMYFLVTCMYLLIVFYVNQNSEVNQLTYPKSLLYYRISKMARLILLLFQSMRKNWLW